MHIGKLNVYICVFLLIFISQPVHAEKRLALVIGNGDYKSSTPLKNPVNDAKSMTRVLQKLNFKVIEKHNLNRRQMTETIRDFGNQLANNDVGLFYFAGHGAQVKGVNYLIPTNSNIGTENEIPFEAVDANRLLAKMESAKNKLNIVILDACRNNPFARSFRSSTNGLARMDAPVGSYISYATAPGKVSSDGVGENGLYTSHLLKHISKPGISINEVFRLTRVGVLKSSKRKQIPWDASSLLDRFCFNGCEKNTDNIVQDKVIPKPLVPAEISKTLPKKNEPESFELIVKSEPPADAIRILNIGPKYSDKMLLKPGKYHVEISKVGYQKHTEWVELNINNQLFEFSLKKQTIKLPKMIALKGGCFQMGQSKVDRVFINSQFVNSHLDERQHKSCVKEFLIGQYEITVREFKQFIKATSYKTTSEKNNKICQVAKHSMLSPQSGYFWRNVGFPQTDNHPVVCVSWHDAMAYADWLSSETGKKYRLPTEAEWEYAARAGTTTIFSTGNDITKSDANFDIYIYTSTGPSFGTKSIKSYRKNSFGLYDMHGNVEEWTCSLYVKNYSGEEKRCSRKNDKRPKVIRGGSFANVYRQNIRSASRDKFAPDFPSQLRGFRLARSQ